MLSGEGQQPNERETRWPCVAKRKRDKAVQRERENTAGPEMLLLLLLVYATAIIRQMAARYYARSGSLSFRCRRRRYIYMPLFISADLFGFQCVYTL